MATKVGLFEFGEVGLAVALHLLYLIFYVLTSGYNEIALIRANIPSAKIALGMSLIGLPLPPLERLYPQQQRAEYAGMGRGGPFGADHRLLAASSDFTGFAAPHRGRRSDGRPVLGSVSLATGMNSPAATAI